jgi:hypothetical protein
VRNWGSGMVALLGILWALVFVSAPAAQRDLVEPSPATAPGTAVYATPLLAETEPELTGVARDGQALTVTVSPSQARDARFQWERCTEDVRSCTKVEGATVSRYTVEPPDVGLVLRAVATLKDKDGSDALVKSPVSQKVTPAAPRQSLSPRVMGRSDLGAEMTAVAELWFGTPPFELSYQWLRCDGKGSGCVAIPGETARTHFSTVADVAGSLAVDVTASNQAGSASARSSSFVFASGPAAAAGSPSSAAGPNAIADEGGAGLSTPLPEPTSTFATCFGNPVNTSPPHIDPPDGSIQAGGVVSNDFSGYWSPPAGTCSGGQFRYAWFRSSGLVADTGTTNAAYQTSSGDVGGVMQSQVTYEYVTDTYHGTSSRSNGVLVTAPPPPPNDPPAVPYEEAFPADGEWTSSTNGPLRVKYSDPEGATGSLQYEVYTEGGSLADSITRSGVVSGSYPNQYLNAGLTSGTYKWRAQANDGVQDSGWSDASFGWFYFVVNRAPATPTHDLPLVGGWD